MPGNPSHPAWVFNLGDESAGVHRKLAEGIRSRVFAGEHAMLSVVRVEPHTRGTIHSHPEEQWGVLLEGECVRIQDGVEAPVRAGDFWHTPGGVAHGVRTGPAAALILDVFSPIRKEYARSGEGFGSAQVLSPPSREGGGAPAPGAGGPPIRPAPPRPPAELVEAFRPMATSHLSDCMDRLCGVVGLRRYHQIGKLVGCAFTVKTRPGDNLLVHKALDLAGPGDVLVVDGGGEVTNALVGELMGMYARRRGLAGFVIDGAVRDVGWYHDFPCYARDNVHRGPYKDGPGEINVPVSVGGLVVVPGDIVVGDEDGLLAIHPDEAPRVLERARAKAREEEQHKRAIAEGRYDRSWVDQALVEKGVIPR